MSTTFPLARPAPTRAEDQPQVLATPRIWPWPRITLIAIMLLSAALELWHLDQLGTSNSFYAAAVLSMMQNWHAFFFNSLDSVGFVTIDKPPLGFWIQVVSAKILGFSGFSILLPEALATIASVGLLYALVKRAFGTAAGLFAALMLALVPISVIVGRTNTIDALLVFTLLLSVFAALHATKRGSLKWLLIAGAIVGLGFEIKMLEAYLVVPALGLVYLLGAPTAWRTRVLHLVLATGVMLVVSLAWPVTVDLTPANLRPWMDSTQNNSSISLALGYNGIQRLIGQRESLTQFLSGLGINLSSSSDATTTVSGFGGGLFNNGPAGAFRLLDQQLAGQASWLLPLSLVGIALGIWRAFRKNSFGFVHTREGQATIVFGTWLLAAGAFFSIANFFHSYYLVTLGPPIAALAAIGLVSAWWEFRTGGLTAFVLPLALMGTAVIQEQILRYYLTWSRWMTPFVVGGPALGAAVLVIALVRRHLQRDRWFSRAAAGIAVAALLIAPLVWSGYSTFYRSNGGLPVAGPQIPGGNGGFGGGGRGGTGGFPGGPPAGAPDGGPGGFAGGGPGGQISTAVINFLETNQGSATYLVATTDSNTAASIILASSGKPVMSLGGFSGSDPILTVDQFASLVRSGQVRYVLAGRGGGGPGRSGGTSAILSWVTANGTLVPSSDLGNSSAQLYDLGSLQGTTA